jgi:hypothetical protein
MKRSTPVIIGVLLILGVVALGYFAESNSVSNNTTNNSSPQFNLLKNPNLTDQTQSSPTVESQQSSTTDGTTTNNTAQNSTQNQTTAATQTSTV